MVLLFKKLSGGRYCIIENQRVSLFDKSGKCIDDNLSITPEYVNGSVKMNYVSVLSSGKRLEVALFVNNTMTLYKSSMKPQDCVMKAFASLKPLCFLRRDGKLDGINYNQAIFVCQDTYTGNGLEELLQLTKLS